MAGMGYAMDNTGMTMWNIESSTATTETFVALGATEDVLGNVKVTGFFEDPWMMMTDTYTIDVANATFPCADCTGMPGCQNPGPNGFCDTEKEGEIGMAPNMTQPLGVTVERGPAGTLTIQGATGDLEIKNPDGTPFVSKHLTGSEYSVSVLLVAGPNFDSDVRLTTVFLPDNGVLDTQDVIDVRMLKINLTIYNGQNGDAVPDNDDEINVGAFTVVNHNDSDGDGVRDDEDNDGVAEADGYEPDLMKLHVGRPVLAKNTDNVVIHVTGAAALWADKKKLNSIPLDANKEVTISANNLPKDIWVEATAVNAVELRSIFIDAVCLYKNVAVADGVTATGVWVIESDFRNQLTDPLWPDAGNPLRNEFINRYGGKFGIQYAAPPVDVQYAMGMEFTVLPPGISNTNVKFDITRQVERDTWEFNGMAVTHFADKYWPGRTGFTSLGPTGPDIDQANDDAGILDEDNTPMNNHIYSIDGPGHANDGIVDQKVRRLNFLEFVRVNFNGITPTGNVTAGSRCSSKVAWRAHMWSEKVGNAYKQRAGKQSAVTLGHKDILPAPTP